MGRSKRYKGVSRDSGPFVALPHSVLDSPAYRALSYPARALLLEVARQFHGDDNGRLLLSRAYLQTRGWKSADVIQRAKRELLHGGFIFETVLGQRPNKASWYALTWYALDKIEGFDPGAAAAFERSAFKSVPVETAKKPLASPIKNALLIPSHGTGGPSIAPSGGTESAPPVPSHGAIRAVLPSSSVPSHGHPLEMPSPAHASGKGNGRARPARREPQGRTA